jgi:hypothetical protein
VVFLSAKMDLTQTSGRGWPDWANFRILGESWLWGGNLQKSGRKLNSLYLILTVWESNHHFPTLTITPAFILNKWVEPPKEAEPIQSESIQGYQTVLCEQKGFGWKYVQWIKKKSRNKEHDKIIQYFPQKSPIFLDTFYGKFCINFDKNSRPGKHFVRFFSQTPPVTLCTVHRGWKISDRNRITDVQLV